MLQTSSQTPFSQVSPTLPPFNQPRLVRLCAYFSGDSQAAEDLAQETLLEAWRNAHKLHDPSGVDHWLAAIARRVCWRWTRRIGRESAHIQWLEADDTEPEWPADSVDLEIDLEREELAILLDRALALLPPETRAVLIERYIHDSPLADVAGRLGLTQGNVAVRLHRGKLALHRLLNTKLQAEAADLGIVSKHGSLRVTPLWCPACGGHRLEGRLDPVAGDLILRCPGCYRRRGLTSRNMNGLPQILKGAKGFRIALTRALKWSDDLIANALLSGETTCPYCGRAVQPKIRRTHYGYQWDASCMVCPSVNTHHLNNRMLASPTALNFWKRYPRMRRLPERDTEAEGAAAVWSGWESVTGNARLEFLVSRNTFNILQVRQTG
jgi:RNA polymerase sigma-70 factor (ECF subfamily)